MNYERKRGKPLVEKLLWITLALIAAIMLLNWLGYTPEDFGVKRPEKAEPVIVINPPNPVTYPTAAPAVITQPEWAEALATGIPVAPPDTTAQAEAVYNENPRLAEDCMAAAVAGRRMSPQCRDVIQRMGQGR